MKPFVLDKSNRHGKVVKDEQLPTQHRKLNTRLKVTARREKRKADKKALRDEWGF